MPTPDLTAVIEAAIRDHRVLAVTYTALNGIEGTVEVNPLAIRFNHSGHRVLWCWKRDEGHVEELLWGRIEAAEPTGEVFEPQPWVEGD